MMLDILYEDKDYRIYLWKNWLLAGRPLQIYFCKSGQGAAPQDDSFYVGRDRMLSTCQGLHPLPYEDYEAVLRIIKDNNIIDKAIAECISIYGSCVYKN